MRLVRQRLNTFYAAVKLPSLYQLRGLGKFDPVDRDDRRITFDVASGGDEQVKLVA
jgi:hypothetical protein